MNFWDDAMNFWDGIAKNFGRLFGWFYLSALLFKPKKCMGLPKSAVLSVTLYFATTNQLSALVKLRLSGGWKLLNWIEELEIMG